MIRLHSILPACLMLVTASLAAQKPTDSVPGRFYLVNTLDSSRSVLIKRKAPPEFHIRLDTVSGFKKVSGFIQDATDTTVKILVESENMEIEMRNGVISTIENDYSLATEFRTLRIQDVSYLKYSNPFRKTFNSAGSTISTLSLLSGLLIAPLVSMDFSNGVFNSTRYLNWTKASIGGLAIGIPITLLSKPRTYEVTANRMKGDRKFWVIVKR